MTTEIEIIVRGEAVAQARPRFRVVKPRSGGEFVSAYNPSHVEKWKSHARLAAQQAMAGNAPFDAALRAEIIVVLPIPKSFSKKQQAQAMCGSLRPTKRPDLDNFIKAGLDACLGIVYRDDSSIVALHASKVFGTIPQMRIRVALVQEAIPFTSQARLV